MENKLFATFANPFGILIFAVIVFSFLYEATSRLFSSHYILFVTNMVGGLAFISITLLLSYTYKRETVKRVRS